MHPIITRVRPDAPEAAALIAELDAHLAPLYPIESQHGFSVQRLIDEDVHFFLLFAPALEIARASPIGAPALPPPPASAGDASSAAGCAGLLPVPGQYGEIKRMYIRPAHRGRGYARLLLSHLEAHAQSLRLPRLRLETGIHQLEAIALYERSGYRVIPPFGPYREDPVSRCYEKGIG